MTADVETKYPLQIMDGLYQLRVPIPNNPLGWVLPYLIEGERRLDARRFRLERARGVRRARAAAQRRRRRLREAEDAARHAHPPGPLRPRRPGEGAQRRDGDHPPARARPHPLALPQSRISCSRRWATG